MKFYRTVLIVASEPAVRAAIKQNLERDVCHVLEADSVPGAFLCVISDSRPIHVLLADMDLVDTDSAHEMARYRPEMQVVFVTPDTSESRSSSLDVKAAVTRTRELTQVAVNAA